MNGRGESLFLPWIGQHGWQACRLVESQVWLQCIARHFGFSIYHHHIRPKNTKNVARQQKLLDIDVLLVRLVPLQFAHIRAFLIFQALN